jgi:DNA repair exonuclease SbcCD ATPase subunit
MATEEIAFKITTDTAQTEKSVKSIKTELREATQEALNLSRKFGDTSKEAIEAQQKVANLKDEVGDFKQRVEALNPDAKFKAFSQSLQGVAGGFAGLQGAVGLFGTESAELEKQLLKVQSALALSEGLNSVLESKDAFTNLAVVIKGNVIKAFTTLKGAIIATGIGAAVVAVGLLVANFDAVKKVVLNLIPGLAKVGEFVGKLVNKITDFVGATSEAERASDRLTKSTKGRNEEIDRQIKLLSAQGGKEADIAKLQKDKAFNDLKNLELQKKANKIAGDEYVKSRKDLINEIKVVDLEEEKRIKDNQAKQAEEQKAAAAKAIQDKKEADEKKKKEDEEIIKRIQEEAKAKKDKADAEALLESQAVESLTLIEEEKSEIKDASNLRDQERASFQAKLLESNFNKSKELAAADLKIKQEKAQGEINLLYAVSNTAGQIADLLGKQSQAGKALAVGQALINTYLGIAAGVKLGYPAAIPAVLAASVTGFKAVKSILAVNIPGGGGGGSMPSGASSSTSFNAPVTAPIQSGVNVQQTAAVGTTNVNLQNQPVIKAYVVESDITDSQERINKIKATATI